MRHNDTAPPHNYTPHNSASPLTSIVSREALPIFGGQLMLELAHMILQELQRCNAATECVLQ